MKKFAVILLSILCILPMTACSDEPVIDESRYSIVNGGFETDLSYAEIARHIQGLGWLGEAKVPAQAADPDDPAGITALFARSEGTNR